MLLDTEAASSLRTPIESSPPPGPPPALLAAAAPPLTPIMGGDELLASCPGVTSGGAGGPLAAAM